MTTKEIPHADLKAARDMAIFYQGFNWLLAKPLEGLSYVRILESNQLGDTDKLLAFGAIFIGSRAYSGLARRTGTKFIGEHYGIDTKRTRVLSLLPYGEWAVTTGQITIAVLKRLPIKLPVLRNLTHF